MNGNESGTDKEIELTDAKSGKQKKIKKAVGIVLFIILNAVVLFFTARADFSNDAPKYDIRSFGVKNLLFLIGAVGCVVVALAVETVKYVIMMRHLGEKVSVRTAFETAALGKYYDFITPSGAGGQPFQIWHLHSHGYSTGASSAMPLLGFITMQFGFVFLALTVFIFNNHVIDSTAIGIKIAAYVGAVAYTIVPIMIVIAAISPKASSAIVTFFVKIGAKIRLIKDPERKIEVTRHALENYSSSLKSIAKSKRVLIELFALSVLFQVALCSLPFFVIHVFGGKIGFFTALSMCVFVYASITIVPTPGNSGAAEGSFYILFSQLENAGLFWAMLVWRFLCYYSFIVIGILIYGYQMIEKIRKKRKIKKNGSD